MIPAIKNNKYSFQYTDQHGRHIIHNIDVSEEASPLDVYESFCDFLTAIYGWDTRKFFNENITS